jgi:AcrR family transcriptional regulator
MAGSLRERRKQLLREEILETAQMLIAEHGYAAMSMDELAAQAGISKPTLYGHFSSKEEVAGEMIIRHMAWFINWIEQPPSHLTPLAQLIELLREFVHKHLAHQDIPVQVWSPDLFRAVCERVEVTANLHRIHIGVRQLSEAAIASGEINPAFSADSVMLTFFSLSNSLNVTRVGGLHWSINTATIADDLATIFEQGVRNPRA